jgi:hypothetical protein
MEQYSIITNGMLAMLSSPKASSPKIIATKISWKGDMMPPE